MLRWKVPPPLPITWEMKEVSTAETAVEELPGGRVEYRIEHELLRDVTPEMLTWWFRHFPAARLEWKGTLVSMYRVWHPRDHILVRVLRRSRTGAPGVSAGAKIAIMERLGPRTGRTVARVRQMDETGLRLVVRRGFFRVADLHHTFTRTPEGTLYRSRLVIGTAAPLVGRAVNALIRRWAFTPEVGEAWLKHNVEEVGNFQFFLPRVYAQRPPDRQ
jgi:DAPG hydrolase-like protein